LPNPRQDRQAGGQRLGVGEQLPAQRDALGDVLQGSVELVPLVGHLGQAHIPDARGGQRRAVGRRGDLQHLPVRPGRRVQAALSVLDLAEVVAAWGNQGRPGEAGSEVALGLRESAAQPFGLRQVPAGDGFQQLLALAEIRQGPRSERGRPLGVTADSGEVCTIRRDPRGHVHQEAGGPAGRRLQGLIRSIRGRVLGVIEEPFDRLNHAAGVCQGRLRQQQPRAGPDQVGGQRRKPPLNRRALARDEVCVEVLLDQPGRPAHLPSGHRVPRRRPADALLTRWLRRDAVPDPAGPFLL
jgi:hypothetical protein